MEDLNPTDDNVHSHYEIGLERDRLSHGKGLLEFERTKELLVRHLPPAGSVVADIGGGPGRYSVWLAQEGYRVIHRDLVALHVQQTLELAHETGSMVESAVGDARSLDLADESVDAVLLLGPLYHLPDREQRVKVLSEAKRVLRPGSPVFAVALSRWAPLLDGVVVKKLSKEDANIWQLWDVVERSGVFMPVTKESFSGYCHRPEDLRREAEDAGLEVVDLVSVEGLGFFMPDVDKRWADVGLRNDLMEAARRIERVPELLGLGPHLMVTAVKPD